MLNTSNMNSIPPVIAFVGKSGSGKTTLIEKLIAIFSGKGLKVGAVKRSHHNIDIDKKGKDSHRFREAGANPTIITGGTFIGIMEYAAHPPDLQTLAERLKVKTDIILVEGFKGEMIDGKSVPTLCFVGLEDDRVEPVAYITADGNAIASSVPSFIRDDAEKIAGWIVENYLNA